MSDCEDDHFISEDEGSDDYCDYAIDNDASAADGSQKALQGLQETCGLSAEDAARVLEVYRGDFDTACAAWFEDPAAVRAKCGLISPDNILVRDTTGDIWKDLWARIDQDPFPWDIQVQLKTAWRDFQGGGASTVALKDSLGDKNETCLSTQADLSSMTLLQGTKRTALVRLQLSDMPAAVQHIIRDTSCHPLAAYQLSRIHSSAPQAAEWWRKQNAAAQRQQPCSSSSASKAAHFTTETLSRLTQELKAMQRDCSADMDIDLVADDLAHWRVLVYKEAFDKDSWLYKDLTVLPTMLPGKRNHVQFEIFFDASYPLTPPFFMVRAPAFRFHSGHVTIGGSICLEMLCNTGTAAGYNSDYTVSNLMRLVLSNMTLQSDVSGFTAGRIEFDLKRYQQAYNVSAAREAFQRVAAQHNWLR